MKAKKSKPLPSNKRTADILPEKSMPRGIFAFFPLLLLGIILLVGAYVRIYKISDYLTFLGDEGRDVLIVKRIIVDHELTFLGPTASVGGFFLGPMYYYFMAPFLWLWRLDPTGPAVMVALFGVATIALLYKVGSDWFDEKTGLIASALYALSPVVIAYSRSSWNPNLVPFFALLFVYLLWRITIYKRQRDYFFLGLVAGFGIQFHYLFLFLFVLAALWLLLFERKKSTIGGIVRAASGFILIFSPLILFELRHSFPNVRAIINFFIFGKETGFSQGSFFLTVKDVAFRSFGRLLYRMPDYNLWNGFPSWNITTWVDVTTTTLLIGLGLLIIYTVAYLLSRTGRNIKLLKAFVLPPEKAISFVLLLLWFLVPVCLFGFYHKGIYDYYFGIFFAVPFLFVALIFRHLMRFPLGSLCTAVLFGTLVYFNWQGRPFIYPPNRQLNQTKEIARAALDLAGDKPYNFALITATNSDHAYRYFFEIWGRKPVTIENTQVDPERKSVTDQLIIICEDPECHPLGNPLWEVAGFGRAEIAEERKASILKVFRLIPYKEKKNE